MAGLRRSTRLTRIALAGLTIAAAFAGYAAAEPAPKAARLGGKSIKVTAEPIVTFDKTRPEAKRFGALEWLGGLVLSSPAPEFGGWSGLVLDAAGEKIVALSDEGRWMTATVAESDGIPSGLRSARIGPLLATNGKPTTRKRDSDGESLALAAGTLDRGQVYIGFERNHRIAVADIGEKGISAPRRFVALPAGAKRMTRNEGLEAVAVLRAGPLKGSLVAIAEYLPDGKGRHTGWIWVKGKPRGISLTNPDDFSVTDAVGLGDGGLLVLERRFRLLEGVRMRLRHVPADDIQPGAVLDGNVLLAADQSREIDNMEALAVHERAGGETVVTLMSDDNFNHVLQRTLLLRFVWRREGVARAE